MFLINTNILKIFYDLKLYFNDMQEYRKCVVISQIVLSTFSSYLS